MGVRGADTSAGLCNTRTANSSPVALGGSDAGLQVEQDAWDIFPAFGSAFHDLDSNKKQKRASNPDDELSQFSQNKAGLISLSLSCDVWNPNPIPECLGCGLHEHSVVVVHVSADRLAHVISANKSANVGEQQQSFKKVTL